MSKYKVGDKVLIEMVIDDFDETSDDFWVGLERNEETSGMLLTEEQIDKYAYKYASKTYEQGRNDAWKLARKIADISTTSERADMFGYCCNGITVTDVLRDFTPQQALAKIEAYEESKAINVGDVVECFSDYKGVVLDCDDELRTLDVFSENGCVEGLAFSDVKKTGKHLDISHLLEQIRG